MFFEITLQDQHLTNVVKRLNAELKNPQRLLQTVGESLLNINKDRHQASKDPDGNAWQPLKKSSLEKKRRGGPLNQTGEMLRSLNYQVDGDTLTIGFDGERNAKLAFWHHHGTPPYLIKPLNKKALKFGSVIVKKVNHPGLPARPLLGLPKSDIQIIEDVSTDYLKHIFNNV